MTNSTTRTLLNKLKEDKTKNGFTLTEMMAVVAIAGIVSAMGLPALTKEIDKAKDSATISTLTNAAKACSLSLITRRDNRNYLDSVSQKPFDANFVNVAGNCLTNGKLTLVSPGRPEDETNNTHIAEITFIGDIPQTAEFRTEVAS